MTSADAQPHDDHNPFLSEEMAQYLQVYIDESDEELEGLTEAILQLEKNPRHAESLNRAFRMLHSLKGSSGMLGFEIVGTLAHQLEERFESYRSGRATLDRETTTLILHAVDFFRAFLSRLRVGDLSQGDPEPLLRQIRDLSDSSRTTTPPATTRQSGGDSPPASHSAVPPQGTPLALPHEHSLSQAGGLRVRVRFRQGLQLADLKARLILSRLSAIGEIVSCDPPVDDIDSFEDLTLFSLCLITAKPVDEVRRIASVDGVESVDVSTSALGGDSVVTALGPSAAQPEEFAVPATAPAPVVNSLANSTPTAPAVASQAVPLTIQDPPQDSVPVPVPVPVPEADADADADADRIGVPGTVVEDSSRDVRAAVQETLRVDIGRLDQLLNLTGELVVANARCNQLITDTTPAYRRTPGQRRSTELREDLRRRFERLRGWLQTQPDGPRVCSELLGGLDEELELLDRETTVHETGHRFHAEMVEAFDQLNRVSRNMQRSVLSTRMIPVGPLFNRFRRVVRDLSVDRGKQVRLVIQGEKTELDKRMIDALGDPLLHLIRNALDHGMEAPAARRSAGKPDVGTITLAAVHRGNNVLITIQDDGSGIQTSRIRTKLVAQGLATRVQADAMSEQQVIETIWQPGFSTASAVTEISGRGVGMDIVRAAISDLSGTIEVSSTAGQGTTFTIRLPQTLAIIHSLLFRCGNGHFAVPIDDVREIVSVLPQQIHAIHRHQAIEVRGALVPLHRLDGIFRWHGRGPGITETEADSPENRRQEVLILQARGKTLGLSVDSLIGRSNLVIKSLSDNYIPVRGLSGAGILGDGTVCLMLDSPAIVDLTSQTRAERDENRPRSTRKQTAGI
ncbi:MAG: chemotaxis protein CheW [Planctomycetota bacterium]